MVFRHSDSCQCSKCKPIVEPHNIPDAVLLGEGYVLILDYVWFDKGVWFVHWSKYKTGVKVGQGSAPLRWWRKLHMEPSRINEPFRY